jgi:N-acetylglutamate synthase-like GNAT family acetyltransferase
MTAADKDTNSPNINISIRHHLKPGDVGYLTYLHGIFYAEACGWDQTFEADVACIMADFARSHNDRERIWIVEQDGKVAGSIGIVEATPTEAQLRVLLLHPSLRGLGVGKRLITEAMQFCREQSYKRIFLLTTSELTAAARLYQAAGFQLKKSHSYKMWSTTVTEQRYELNL